MGHSRAVVYGVLIWAFVFITAMFAFPLRATERPLFESIMPVALALAVTFASLRYFTTTKKRTFMVGFCLGLIWLGVSLILDFLMFSWGPMKMSLIDYIKDIGVTYFMILIIPSGVGWSLKKKRNGY